MPSARVLRATQVMTKVVSVTRKGQATIPKELRDKFRVSGKVQVVEIEEGILLKAIPRPEDDFRSLTKLFKGKTAQEVVDQARAKDRAREKTLRESVENGHRLRH
jgi:AbrB family looped-hinge helix DNA binding protein